MLDRPPPATDTWTPERIETLRTMLASGHSYGEIAKALGRPLTHNSCIGKAKRMGLQQAKRAPSLPPKRNGNRGKPKAPAIVHRVLMRPQHMPDPMPEAGVDVTGLIGLLQLNDSTCKWPIGDPLKPDFGFCGGNTKDGSPYCPVHYARAYRGEWKAK